MRCLPTITLAICAIAVGAIAPANATTVCVSTAGDLQNALLAAQGSTSATTIKVARGTYSLAGTELSFLSQAAGQGQLDIGGGYNYDGGLCSTQIKNPALTIIDGNSMSGVLSLTSTAGISVRYLTIKNGLKADDPGLYVDISGGGIIIDYNIIQNNRATTGERAGLGAFIDGGSGNMHIDGNLIVDNSANSNIGGGDVENSGTGNTYVTNNTVANNTITGTLVNGYGGLALFSHTTPNVSNNIFWGNTNLDFASSSSVLVDNDYGTIGGSVSSGSGGNVQVDPQFSSTTDFHLLPTSPLLGQGTLTATGGLPTIDTEGHPRSYNGLVDMGAYERGDMIFNDAFDN